MRTVPVVLSALLAAALFAAPHGEYPAAFSSTIEGVRDFLGTANAKLVYVNWTGAEKALHYIDFSQGSGEPQIERIAAALKPTAPVKSPCGRWVVYASAEGVYGEAGTPRNRRSSVYLCEVAPGATPVLIAADSAYEPRFVQNAEVLSVIYPTLAPDLAWEGIGTTMIARIDTTGGTPQVTATEVFFEHGSYTGGLSWDGRYLCGGGRTVAMIDLQSGNTRPDTLLHPYSGQACNASITSSRVNTNRMMYLDFGSANQAVAGVNNGLAWGTWEVIIVTDSAGGIVADYPVPANPAHPYSFIDATLLPPSPTTDQETFNGLRWHHPEWSNHPYFAVATINVNRKYRNPDVNDGRWANHEQQERVTLLNLVTGQDHEVIRRGDYTWNTEGRGFYWPWLWVEVPEGFSETSIRRGAVHPQQSGSLRFAAGVVSSRTPLSALHLYDVRGRLLYAHPVTPGQNRVTLASLPEFPGAVLLRAFAGSATQAWKVPGDR